jgi:acetoin utilization deacetylase AcuC-like enzyme
MTTLFFSPDYLCDGYHIDTKEKARDVIAALADRPIPGVSVTSPEPVTLEQLLAVHDPRYVRGILDGQPEEWAERNGIGEWSRGLRDSTLASTGGVVASAILSYTTRVNSGSASSGLHHAGRSRGAGFCTFNGLAIAAREVLVLGARRVLILDLDAHCGGGTASLIDGVEGVEQVDVSVNSYDSYEDTANARLTMSIGETYLEDVAFALAAVDEPGTIDLILYNAGMDPHERCRTGGEQGISTAVLARRERMVFDWARGNGVPVSYVFAGGYASKDLPRAELAELHLLTVAEAAR